MKRLAFLASALFLIGCGSDSHTLPYPLEIRDEGVGAFHPGNPFDPKILASTAIGFDVEKVSQISPTHPQTILLLKRGSDTILYLSSDESGEKIASVTVLSPLVTNPRGPKIGDPIPNDPTLHCDGDECRCDTHPAIIYRLDEEHRTIREITLQRL